jgi:carboxylesterase type B
LNLYKPHFGTDAAADAKDMEKLGGSGKKLPIVIYVHGGGFNGGRGMERNMASFVSWAETPTMGISFNYRVGALGFLPSSVTAKEGLLNLGLKDQQMLFAWVQKNAASFGGDPENVTLMGLSAGSHSIGHQLISYSPANKLTSDAVPFQKAIIESGGATARAVFAPSHPLHEKQFQEFLGECGLSMTPDDQIFTKLRALPLSKIQQASNTIWNRYNGAIRWPFQPTIDGPGGVIPDLPLQSWQKGNVLRIPVLTGFNTNEGAIFLPTGVSDSSALRQVMGAIIPALNETSLEVMEAIYPDPLTSAEGRDMYITKPPAGFGKQFWRLDDAYAHYAYICPVLQTGHYVSSYNTSNSEPPVYIYQFAARSQAHGATDHGDEAPVIAHDMQVLSQYPGLTDAADAMTGYWSRFAAYGDPNPTPYTSLPANLSIPWEGFNTPFSDSFSPDGNDGGSDSTAGGKGQIALFGDGNNERMLARGRGSIGVPVQMTTLTDRVVMECRYWMDRVVYSEGFGNGSLTV